MAFPSLTLFPGSTLFPAGPVSSGPPISDGRSTVYTIGSTFCAVNNGQPYVDEDGTWWKVTREEGWSSGAPARYNTTKWAASDGQRSSQLFQDSRQIILGGTIRAANQLLLHKAMDKVTAVLADETREDLLTVAEPHVRRHISVHRTGTPQVAKVSPWTATFVIYLEADDPRRLGDTLTATTLLPVSTGAWTFPMTWPMRIDSTFITGLCSLTNDGLTPGPTLLRVDGPCDGPVITHVSTGSTLAFATDYSIAAGNWITVDMENMTVLENDQGSRAGTITEPGFFGFDVGLNTYAFAAAAPSPTAKFTVFADPAWP